MGWFTSRARPSVRITAQTQNGVCEYLLRESKERNKSTDPELKKSSERILFAANDFLIDINKPQAAIRVLKGMRLGIINALPTLDAEDSAAAIGEKFLIETMLKDLGVTDFGG